MARYRFRQGASKELRTPPKSNMPTTAECEEWVHLGVLERIGRNRYRLREGVKVHQRPDGSVLVEMPHGAQQ